MTVCATSKLSKKGDFEDLISVTLFDLEQENFIIPSKILSTLTIDTPV